MVSRGRDELETAAAEMRGAGTVARAMPFDVTDPAQVDDLFRGLDHCDVLLKKCGRQPAAALS